MKLLSLFVSALTLCACSSNRGADHQTTIGSLKQQSSATLPSEHVVKYIFADLKKDLFDTPLRQKIENESLHNFTPAHPDETAITWRAHISKPDQVVHIKDNTTGNPIATLVHNKAIQSTSFNLKQKLMAFANYDKSVDIFDLNKPQLLHTFPHGAAINYVEFNLDGTQLIVAGNDSNAHIWDITTGKRIDSFEHSSWVHAATFNKEGNLIAVVDFNNTVHIWDLKTKRLLHKLPHANTIRSVQFNLEGTQLLAQEACNLESYADLAFPNINFSSIAHLWHLPISHKYNTYVNSLTPAQAAHIYYTWQHIVHAQSKTIPDELLTRLQLLQNKK